MYPMNTGEEVSLRQASPQQIQLELIRRQCFNAFNGPKIVASLLRHKNLWQAVLMDSLGHVSQDDDHSNAGLIKLRDLPRNMWNVDRLFVLTDTLDQAQELERIANDDEWDADVVRVISEHDERMRALGTSRPGYIVSAWWD